MASIFTAVSCTEAAEVRVLTYNLHFEVTSKNRLDPIIPVGRLVPGSGADFDLLALLEGRIELKVSEVSDSITTGTIIFVTDTIQIAASGYNMADEDLNRLKKELAQGINIKLGKGLHILGIEASDTMSLTALNLITGMLSEIQFAADASTVSSADSWSAVESDAIGRYKADYELLSGEGDLKVFKKHKGDYSAIRQRYGFKKEMTFFTQSENIFSVRNNDPLLLTVQSNGLQAQYSGVDTISRSEWSIKIAFAGENQLKGNRKSSIANPEQLNWVPLDQVVSDRRIIRENDKNVLGADSSQQIIEYLLRFNELKNPQNGRMAFRKALAFIRLYPDQTENLEMLLQLQTPKVPSWEPLCHAFIRSGTASAHAFIGQYLRRNIENEEIVNKILVYITLSDYTSPLLEQAVKELVKRNHPHYAYTAQLTWGAIAGNCKTTQPQRAKQIMLDLLPVLKAQGDVMQELLVMGNAGTEDAEAVILQTLYAWPSDEIAALALSSLKFTSVTSDSILTYYAKRATAPEVRKAAEETLLFRKQKSIVEL